METPLDQALAEALRPVMRQIIREEVARAGFEWTWRTVEQTAELLGITPNAVRHRARRGTLPSRVEDGRIWIDLKAFDAELRRRPATVSTNIQRDRAPRLRGPRP